MRASVEEWRERGDATPASAVDDEHIMAVQMETAHELVEEQLDAGLDLPTDGYIPVYDEWFGSAYGIEGITVESPIRYLDTNTYYHNWRITNRPLRTAPNPQAAVLKSAAGTTDSPLKACLFGPYTIWNYANRNEAAAAAFEDLVDIWVADVRALVDAGASYIQLDESVLLRSENRSDVSMVRTAVERISATATGATVILQLTFGAIGDLLEPVLRFPRLGGLGLDFAEDHRDANLLSLNGWPDGLLLQAGIADARSVRVETPAELEEVLTSLSKRVPAENCLVSPNAGLHYLPRRTAFSKLRTLSAAAHAFKSREVEN